MPGEECQFAACFSRLEPKRRSAEKCIHFDRGRESVILVERNRIDNR